MIERIIVGQVMSWLREPLDCSYQRIILLGALHWLDPHLRAFRPLRSGRQNHHAVLHFASHAHAYLLRSILHKSKWSAPHHTFRTKEEALSPPDGEREKITIKSKMKIKRSIKIKIRLERVGFGQPRNTMAGSRLRILRMPREAASQQMKRTAPKVIKGSCQGRKNGGMPFLRQMLPKRVARPTPQP